MSKFVNTLLTLFTLLFSFSVFAGDDLSGKKLYCLGDPKEAKNYAFIFETENQVKIHETFIDNRYRTLSNVEYYTDINEIGVFFEPEYTDPDDWMDRYYINRKSLDFIHIPNLSKPAENKTMASCEITTEDPLKIISTIAIQQIENIKKDNKL